MWHFRKGGLPQLQTYRKRRAAQSHSPDVKSREGRRGNLIVEPWPLPKTEPRRELRVGVILDGFSELALQYEWIQIALRKESWQQQVHNNPIELLFVESAWNGNAGSWQYCLTGPSAPARELQDLIQWCKDHQIPTVFWNKEDPVHFEDFLPTARLFDHVFTTDSNKVADYHKNLGHKRVGVMPFAAQELIHNPIRPRSGFHDRDLAFGGMYFAHRHDERREQMDLLLGAALDVSPRMKHGLEIYSRYLGTDTNYQFPGELAEHVVGSLSYEEMLTAYRLHKVFLNINTVTNSPSMCARRIFEIIASGTPIISTPSQAIDEFFDESMITQVESREHASAALRALVNSKELRASLTHRAQREVWKHHTYNHRINDVLRQIGLPGHIIDTIPSVSMLASTNRPRQLKHLIHHAGAQVGVEKELVLLTHGFKPTRRDIARLAEEADLENIVLLHAEPTVPLGECLNILARAASGEFAAKFDDDDFYGPNYLRDQAFALQYSGAEVVGKEAHFIQFERLDLMALHTPDREHRFTDFIPGPTIFTRTETVRNVEFPKLPRGEDSGFLRRVSSSGAKIYSSDKNQFVRYRNNNGHQHTWTSSDWSILANSRVQYHSKDIRPAMI